MNPSFAEVAEADRAVPFHEPTDMSTRLVLTLQF